MSLQTALQTVPRFLPRLLPRRPALLPALALLPLALAGCGTQAKNAGEVQQDLLEAQRHVQVDPDDKQARQWADRAIAVAPRDAATYFGDAGALQPRDGIAQVFLSVGDDPAVADYMAQAVQKFPDDYRGGLLLTSALGRLGRDADRKAAALKMIAALPPTLQKPNAADLPERTQALAQAYFDAGDVASGTARYQQAIKAYPTDPDLPNGLAYALANANVSLPQALALSQQSLTLAKNKGYSDEQTAGLLDTLGWVQCRQGDFKNAAQNLQEAAARLPREAETRYHLGVAYAALGQPEAARAELGHAVLLSQNYAAAEAALRNLPAPAPS